MEIYGNMPYRSYLAARHFYQFLSFFLEMFQQGTYRHQVKPDEWFEHVLTELCIFPMFRDQAERRYLGWFLDISR